MVVLILTTVFVGVLHGVLAYKGIKKRRARKRAIKLAALDRTVNSPVAVNATGESLPEDEVVIIGREQYLHLTVPGFGPPGIRDKPPSYSATMLQVQNP
ncbi:hypothetical protein F5888DRAFT_1803366 [Russula emetica]|nr:hypothetical protein F5888DRAFT_1803366 [Russula emetica]